MYRTDFRCFELKKKIFFRENKPKKSSYETRTKTEKKIIIRPAQTTFNYEMSKKARLLAHLCDFFFLFYHLICFDSWMFFFSNNCFRLSLALSDNSFFICCQIFFGYVKLREKIEFLLNSNFMDCFFSLWNRGEKLTGLLVFSLKFWWIFENVPSFEARRINYKVRIIARK